MTEGDKRFNITFVGVTAGLQEYRVASEIACGACLPPLLIDGPCMLRNATLSPVLCTYIMHLASCALKVCLFSQSTAFNALDVPLAPYVILLFLYFPLHQ